MQDGFTKAICGGAATANAGSENEKSGPHWSGPDLRGAVVDAPESQAARAF